MTTTTFTPAQQALHDTLMGVDRRLLVIARDMLQAWTPTVDLDPEDFGAPIGTPAWDKLDDAMTAFDRAMGRPDDQAAIEACLPVVLAAIATKR